MFLEIDKNHLQQVNFPINILPKGGDKYEIVLPEEGMSKNLYNYNTENMEAIASYPRPKNKIIKVNDTSRLILNSNWLLILRLMIWDWIILWLLLYQSIRLLTVL